MVYPRGSSENLLQPEGLKAPSISTAPVSTDSLWNPGSSTAASKPGGFRALSTPILGLYKDLAPSKRPKPRSNKSWQPDFAAIDDRVLAANNARFNPDAEHVLDTLKVVMMNLRPGQGLPHEQNQAVYLLLEILDKKLRDEKAKIKEVEEAKAEAEAAIEIARKNTEAWKILEAGYKKEVKKLELLLAQGKSGLEAVTLSRSKSRLGQHRAAFKKTTSNLSDFGSGERRDGGRSNRQKSTGGTISASKRQSTQVFDHKRTSQATTDKLFADFGTNMDSQLSKSLQHHEDAVAGAARQKWQDCRARDGYTGSSISLESSQDMAAGLGLELYDSALVQQDPLKPLPPPRVVLETDGGERGEADVDEGDEIGFGGDDLVEIQGGGFVVKPKNRIRVGSRAKAFFSMGRKKLISPTPEELDSDYSTSSSTSDSDDVTDDKAANHSLAHALFGMTSIATRIASPLPGTDQAPSAGNAGLQLPKMHGVHPKNKKSSGTNLSGLMPYLKAGMKKKNDVKAAKVELARPSKSSDAKYERAKDQSSNVFPPERGAYSEAPRPFEKGSLSINGERGVENILPPMNKTEANNYSSMQKGPQRPICQPGRNISHEAPSNSTLGPPRRYYGSVRNRGRPRNLLETRSTSSLRYEYDTVMNHGEDEKTPTAHDLTRHHIRGYVGDEDEDNVSTYGKSNSVCGSFYQAPINNLLRPAGDKALMELRIVAEMQERVEARNQAMAALTGAPQHGERFQLRDVSAAYGRTLPTRGAADRVFEPELARRPPPAPLDDNTSYSTGTTEQSPRNRDLMVLAGKSQGELREEREATEAASRRVLMRASGHQFLDEEPSWGEQQQHSDPFRPIETPLHDTKDRPVSGSPPLTARKIACALEAGDPYVFPPTDDSLIRVRSARAGRAEGELSAELTADNLNRDAHEPLPYWLYPKILERAIDEDRDTHEARADEGREDEQRANTVARLTGTNTVIATRRPRESIMGIEDFMRTLHGESDVLCGGLGPHAPIPQNGSQAVNNGGNRSYVLDGRNVESRGASDSSGEGPYTPDTSSEDIFNALRPKETIDEEAPNVVFPVPGSRHVTAVYQGQTSGNENSPFAPGDTPHSTLCIDVGSCSLDTSTALTNTRGRTNERVTSDRTRNDISEPREQRHSSGGQVYGLGPPRDHVDEDTMRTHDRVISAGSVRDRILQLQERSESPSQLFVPKHRRGGSSQSRGGRRDESTSSIGSLRSPADPALTRIRNDLLTNRRGVSGQHGSAHTRNLPGTTLMGGTAPRNVGGEQKKTKNMPQASATSAASASTTNAVSRQASGDKKEERAGTVNPALAAARRSAHAAEKRKLEENAAQGKK